MNHSSISLTSRRGWLAACTCLACVTLPLSAQQAKTYQATGVVCDSVSHEPQAYATIRLLPAGKDAKPVRVATTQANGRFSITAPKAGTYTLETVVTGMQPLRREVTFSAAQPTVALDTLYIKEYSSTLGSATVTAAKPLVKAEIDKLTYSIADDPDSQTSTVLEMLRKVPMVTVDGDDNIKVNGNSSFKVYVNGKPNQMMSQNPSLIFKTYPASAIKKIEVITNPGAKYDAEGTAGVLNIITESETHTSGYVITPSFNYSNRGVGGNLFGMAQFGKLTLSLNYGLGSQRSAKPFLGTTEREYFNDPDSHTTSVSETIDQKGLFQFGNLDASYELSRRDLLSASVGLHSWRADNTSDGTTVVNRQDGSLFYSYDRHRLFHERYEGVDASTDYQHSFTDDRRLTLSYRYNLSPGNTNEDVTYARVNQVPAWLGLTDLNSKPDRLSYEHTAQADFTTNLDTAKVHTLSMGLKYIYRINRSNSREWTRPYGSGADYVLDDARSLRYRHRGDIAAAYLEYNLKKNPWSLMAGSRYEYYRASVTYPDGKREPFHSDMSDWVPSLSLGYSLSPSQMLKTGYNLRISRPDIYFLSPYVDRTTPESISYGDPTLSSTRSHNLNLTYSTFSAKFTFNAALTYSFSNNDLASYSFIKDGVINTTYANVLHSKNTSLSCYMNWMIWKGTVLNVNANGWYVDYRANTGLLNAHNSGWAANVWANVRQNLPWKLNVTLWGGYNTPDIQLQSKTNRFYAYGLTLNRSFLKDDRLTVTVSGTNIFSRYVHLPNETLTEQFRASYNTRIDMLRVGFTVRYRFGSLNTQVKKAERTINNDDVKSGGGGGSQGQGGGM